MERIWDTERAEGSHELRLSTLHKLRGVRMIADTHLTNALDSLGDTERQIAVDMFDHLVTPSGGKIAESVPDLAARTGHSEAAVGDVLAKLDQRGIVRPVPAARATGSHPVPPLRDLPRRAGRADQPGDRGPRGTAAHAADRRLAALAMALLIVVTSVAITFAILANNANNATQAATSTKS